MKLKLLTFGVAIDVCLSEEEETSGETDIENQAKQNVERSDSALKNGFEDSNKKEAKSKVPTRCARTK